MYYFFITLYYMQLFVHILLYQGSPEVLAMALMAILFMGQLGLII